LCPLIKEVSLTPPKEINLVSLFKDFPIALAIVDLPVPGGPYSNNTNPLLYTSFF